MPESMEPFRGRDKIEHDLTVAFVRRYKRKDAALTGILLARPEDPIARDLVLPSLEYWHHRSNRHTDFFCAGYAPMVEDPTAEPVDVRINGSQWAFSLPGFIEIVAAVEHEAKWKYEGDACLVLASAFFNGSYARLDFRRCLHLNFREALEDKAIGTPTQLVEGIFHIAQVINEGANDPVWELSDRLGHKVIKSGVKDALLALLPEWLAPSTKKAIHFAVHQHAGEA
jgi:hypothetical protein